MASAGETAPGAILASLFFNEDILPVIIHHLGEADAKGLRLLSRGLRTAFDKQASVLSVSGPDACACALAARCIMRGCRPQVLRLGGYDVLGAQAFLHTLIDVAAATPSRPVRTSCLHFWHPFLLRPVVLRSAAAALPGLTQLSLVVWNTDEERRDKGEAALAAALGGGAAGGSAQPPLLPSVRSVRLTYGSYDTLTPGLHAALATSSQLQELILEGQPLTELAQVEQIACLSQLQSLTLNLELRRPNVGYRDGWYLPEDGFDEPPLPEPDDPQPAPGDPPTESALVSALLPGQLTGLTRLELSSVGTALPAAALRGLTGLRELVGYDVDVAGVSGLRALTSLKANTLVPFVGAKPWVAHLPGPLSAVESWPLPRDLERLELSPRHPEELGFLSPGPALREVVLVRICSPSPNGVTLVLSQGRHTASEESEELLPAAEEALCRAAAFLAAQVQATRCLSLSVCMDGTTSDGGQVCPRLLPMGGVAAMEEDQPSHGRWLAAFWAMPSLTRLELGNMRLAAQDFDAIATHLPGLKALVLKFSTEYPPDALARLGRMPRLEAVETCHVCWPGIEDGRPFPPAVLEALERGLLGLYSPGVFRGTVQVAGRDWSPGHGEDVSGIRGVVARVQAALGREVDVHLASMAVGAGTGEEDAMEVQ